MLHLELRALREMMIQFQHLKQSLNYRVCVSIIMLSGIMMTPCAINLTVSEAFLSLPSFNEDSSGSYFVPEAVRGIRDKGINEGNFH